MAIVQYTDLHELMVPELPACPLVLINQALYRAGRDFLERSRAWEEDLEAVDLVASTAEYKLKVAWSAVVESIVSVRIRNAEEAASSAIGRPLDDREYRLERDDSATGHVLILSGFSIPSANVAAGMIVRACLVPEQGEHELPQWLLERYSEGIVGTAMSDLMTRHPDDAWYNPPRSTFYSRRARNAVGSGRADRIQKGRSRPRGLLEDRDGYELGGPYW